MRTRITVSLTDEAAGTVEAIAASEGISVSEVIRRALGTLKFVHDETAKGSTLLVRHPNGDQERIQFVWAG